MDHEAHSSIRVLVIDDSHTIRRSAELYLTEAGCEVLLAEDGFEALVKITDHQPQVIFVDVMMPRLDGFGLLAAIRADEQTRTLPVILLSARAGEEARIEGVAAGANDYLIKPFSARELLARAEWLDQVVV